MNKNKKYVIEFFLIVFTIVGIFLVVGGFALKSYLNIQQKELDEAESASYQESTTLESLPPELTESKPEPTLETKDKERKVINVLVLGLDKDQTRSDVMFVVNFDTKTKNINIISLPRDTRVSLSGYGYVKLNAVHAYKGANETVKEVSELLNIRIDNYVKVNFTGFRNIVDAIGGVEMEVPQAMYYSDPEQNLYINLKAGYQTLDGKKAEQLVRFRSYPQADLKRIEVQQLFMKALLKKVLNLDNLIKKAPELAYNMLKYVKTDIGIDTILDYIPYINDIKAENVKMYTLPGVAQTINDASYFIYDKTETAKLVKELFYAE